MDIAGDPNGDVHDHPIELFSKFSDCDGYIQLVIGIEVVDSSSKPHRVVSLG